VHAYIMLVGEIVCVFSSSLWLLVESL